MPLPRIFAGAISDGLLSRNQKRAIGIIHWTNVSIVASFLISLQWVGWWNLLAYNIWPDSFGVVRDTVYISIGILLLYIAEKYVPLGSIDEARENEWALGIPRSFSWSRKLTNYLISYLHFLAFLFFWVGAWTVFDEYVTATSYRDYLYLILPTPVLYFSQEVMSRESLCWMFLKYKRWNNGQKQSYSNGEDKALLKAESSPNDIDPSILKYDYS